MQQMTSCLHLAGATHIGGIDVEAVEWVLAEDNFVVGQNRAELEWKSIEGPLEFVLGQEERRRQTARVPIRDVAGTPCQVFSRQRVDNSQRLRAPQLVMSVVRSVPASCSAKGIRDERQQATAEYFLDFADKNRHLIWHLRHGAIVR